jgi:23S rRNA G2445 N2-methylase RlmL
VKYVAQCTAGLQDLLASQLKTDRTPGLKIITTEDGLVFFETSARPVDLIPIAYLSNIFGVIAHCDLPGLGIEDTVRWLSRNPEQSRGAKRLVTPNERSFRVSVSDEGRLVPGGKHLGSLMDALAKATGLTHSSHHADTEFWIMRRRSGLCFLCKRLKRRAKTEKDLQRGELRPELAQLLCLLSEPTKVDIFLDPFAGSGAIPFARATHPYNMLYALDADEEKVKRLRQEIKLGRNIRPRKDSPMIVGVANATNLQRFDEGFITKIVTDPPWGLYDSDIGNVGRFYRDLTAELIRITRTGAIIVMLIGDKAVADQLNSDFEGSLKLSARYEILVNGKKASVMKWRRDGS